MSGPDNQREIIENNSAQIISLNPIKRILEGCEALSPVFNHNADY